MLRQLRAGWFQQHLRLAENWFPGYLLTTHGRALHLDHLPFPHRLSDSGRGGWPTAGGGVRSARGTHAMGREPANQATRGADRAGSLPDDGWIAAELFPGPTSPFPIPGVPSGPSGSDYCRGESLESLVRHPNGRNAQLRGARPYDGLPRSPDWTTRRGEQVGDRHSLPPGRREARGAGGLWWGTGPEALASRP